jgi:hypothetical protein
MQYVWSGVDPTGQAENKVGSWLRNYEQADKNASSSGKEW